MGEDPHEVAGGEGGLQTSPPWSLLPGEPLAVSFLLLCLALRSLFA